MSFSKTQVAIMGGVLLLVLVFVLIFTGVIPGLKEEGTETIKADITFWGIEEKSLYDPIINSYRKFYPGVNIRYTQINENRYEQDLVNALAAGQGPDIFMIHNDWLIKHYRKISPLPTELLTLRQFQQSFPAVVEQDFAPDGIIYALPLSVDTLALYYNRNLFDQARIAVPPTTWKTFQDTVGLLKKINPANNELLTAGAAIGGSDITINEASDILTLLMLQAGTKMVTDDFREASFSRAVQGVLDPGLQSLQFYTQFANPSGRYYTWNDNFLNSLDAFAQEKSAMLFGYSTTVKTLKEKNPLLNYGIVPAPQPDDNSLNDVNIADYWGYAVSSQSKAAPIAWSFLTFMTTNSQNAENYALASGKPPALRVLIAKYQNDQSLGVFTSQILTARSWRKADNVQIDKIFSDMIKNVISGRLSASEALRQAENQVTQLMRNLQGQ